MLQNTRLMSATGQASEGYDQRLEHFLNTVCVLAKTFFGTFFPFLIIQTNMNLHNRRQKSKIAYIDVLLPIFFDTE